MTGTQWALVLNGELVKDKNGKPVATKSFGSKPEGHSEAYPPECEWYPIVNVDDKPFDIKRHIREVPPEYRVKGKNVERVYQIRAFR